VTFGFNPVRVLKRYEQGEELLFEIKAVLRPRGRPGKIWRLFCDSALSGARFLAGFTSARVFHAWVDVFHQDDRKLPALPLLLSREIAGFGFALSCDFLKELGYFKLAKPDVQLRRILEGLALVEPKANAYAVFKAVLRIAGNCKRTAYDVDKTFWLVGSGRFYRHKRHGKELRIPVDRDEFVRWARRQLDHPRHR